MIKKRNDLRDNIGVRKARQKDMTMYNPMQSQLDRITQQRQMLEQQEQILRQNMQQYQMPPININNQITPSAYGTYDFGCKWINDESEANNLPNNVIGFYKNDPIFIMSGKKFRFSEIVEQSTISVDEKINTLESKINTILERLSENNINTLENKESGSNGLKSGKKGVNKDE